MFHLQSLPSLEYFITNIRPFKYELRIRQETVWNVSTHIAKKKKKSRISAKGIQRITSKNESIKETEELKDHKLNEIRDIIISFLKIGEKKVQAFK